MDTENYRLYKKYKHKYLKLIAGSESEDEEERRQAATKIQALGRKKITPKIPLQLIKQLKKLFVINLNREPNPDELKHLLDLVRDHPRYTDEWGGYNTIIDDILTSDQFPEFHIGLDSQEMDEGDEVDEVDVIGTKTNVNYFEVSMDEFNTAIKDVFHLNDVPLTSDALNEQNKHLLDEYKKYIEKLIEIKKFRNEIIQKALPADKKKISDLLHYSDTLLSDDYKISNLQLWLDNTYKYIIHKLKVSLDRSSTSWFGSLVSPVSASSASSERVGSEQVGSEQVVSKKSQKKKKK